MKTAARLIEQVILNEAAVVFQKKDMAAAQRALAPFHIDWKFEPKQTKISPSEKMIVVSADSLGRVQDALEQAGVLHQTIL